MRKPLYTTYVTSKRMLSTEVLKFSKTRRICKNKSFERRAMQACFPGKACWSLFFLLEAGGCSSCHIIKFCIKSIKSSTNKWMGLSRKGTAPQALCCPRSIEYQIKMKTLPHSFDNKHDLLKMRTLSRCQCRVSIFCVAENRVETSTRFIKPLSLRPANK